MTPTKITISELRAKIAAKDAEIAKLRAALNEIKHRSGSPATAEFAAAALADREAM